MAQKSQGKFLLTILLIIVIGVVGYYVLNAPDERNGVQKVGDAISELPNGADKAARQLEDRTIGDKLNDAAKDAGNNLERKIDE